MDDERRCGHAFGQDEVKPGERKTAWVVALTAVMMVIEIAAGLAFGSIALLADGLHMASHTAALGIALGAYVVARRLARDRRFSFGTGKLNALAGFSSALLLAGLAALMVWESLWRFVEPVPIAFGQALGVAALGLLANTVSAVILASGAHAHGEEHGPSHADAHRTLLRGGAGHGDHNLRGAYLHVLADALTSILAIGALLGGWLLGWIWLDPAMGIVGAGLVVTWAFTLVRDTARVLLDREAPGAVREAVLHAIEEPQTTVADLHVWAIGPDIYTLVLAVQTREPRPPEYYKARLPEHLGIVHPIIEVRPRP